MKAIQNLYEKRFCALENRRKKVWGALVKSFFKQYIGQANSTMDLGGGYGEFINAVQVPAKYLLDINPAAQAKLNPNVIFYCQDSSHRWPLPDNSLDAIFSSNFFEHLSNKEKLEATLKEAYRCLKKTGKTDSNGAKY